MSTVIEDRWQQRRGTAADLAAVNEVPLEGERIFEIDTGKAKDGDGVTHYNDLPYEDEVGSSITGVNEQTGTTYTLVLLDAFKAVRCTNTAAIALTIPTHATVALPLYRVIPIIQGDAGVITIAGATGVTIESPNGAATTGVGDFRTLFQRDTDKWVIG